MLRRHPNIPDETSSKDNSDTAVKKNTSKTSLVKRLRRPRVSLLLIATIYILDIPTFLQSPSIWYESQVVYPWYRMSSKENPSASLAGSLSTRRQALDTLSLWHRRYVFEREDFWVERHLRLQQRDMGPRKYNFTKRTTKKTVVLFWSGTYPVWNARVNFTIGVDKKCNIPCEWTTDRNYEIEHPGSNITGIVCLLYGLDSGKCRDISKSVLGKADSNSSGKIPILGVTWENDWKWKSDRTDLDEMPRNQLTKLRQNVDYNLISSHELDSHIPIIYPQLSSLVSRHKINSTENITLRVAQQLPEVMFAISNCQASMRPDRLGLLKALQNYKIPLASFGKCLGNPRNYHQPWNTRERYGSKEHKEAMSKYMFVFAPENSYGIDYVTEKLYLPLLAGSVPIYMGAPNVGAYLPDRDAAIHVSDFDSPKELADYLRTLMQNRSLLVERHHKWRTKLLPTRLPRLAKLTDRHSKSSFMCKVCNCMNGRIGCPSLLSS